MPVGHISLNTEYEEPGFVEPEEGYVLFSLLSLPPFSSPLPHFTSLHPSTLTNASLAPNLKSCLFHPPLRFLSLSIPSSHPTSFLPFHSFTSTIETKITPLLSPQQTLFHSHLLDLPHPTIPRSRPRIHGCRREDGDFRTT